MFLSDLNHFIAQNIQILYKSERFSHFSQFHFSHRKPNFKEGLFLNRAIFLNEILNTDSLHIGGGHEPPTLAKNIFLASFDGFSKNVNNLKIIFTKMLITSKINIQLNIWRFMPCVSMVRTCV